MAVKGSVPPSISSNSTTLVDIPLPSASITNKPSTGTSLYHTCRSVLDNLELVEGMTFYLDNITLDPLNKLWQLCRKGAPLAALFNSLNPTEPLKIDSNAQQVNECKKVVYHFIVACRNQLDFGEDDLFTLSDLYQDNTNGFVKVINTINLILKLLEEKGVISCSNSTNRNSFNEPKDTRDKVVNELLETERKYVQDLEILQNYMRELQIQEILNPDTIHYLFGNLNTLVDFQRRFLIQLEEIGEKEPEEQNFGSLFRQQEQQFTVYEPYCSNFFSAQYLVQQEAPKLQKLSDILNAEYELPSMLIKPVQRICKYPLLLQQLIKATNSDWPYVDDLEQGLQAIKRVAEKVNETQRKYENIQVVENLKKKLGETKQVQFDLYGDLLLHEKLKILHENNADREMFIYFFEKALLFYKENEDNDQKTSITSIKMRRKKGGLQSRGLIPMNRVLAVKSVSTGERNWRLKVDWKESEVNNIILGFRNEEITKLWESTLKKTMTPQKSNVSNTQLASMKNTTLPDHLTASLRDDDDDNDDSDDYPFTDEPNYYSSESESSYQQLDEQQQLQGRLRSNSLSAHLLNSLSGRPKIPRNMSVDQANTYFSNTMKRGPPIPRSNSSANIQQHNDFNYPVSPPPSSPSSPTTAPRMSHHSNKSSPLTDLANKLMISGITDPIEDEYWEPVPQHQTRHRSQSSPNIPQQQPQQQPSLPPSLSLHQIPTSPLESSPLRSPSSPYMPGTIKVKVNYNDGIYAILCNTEIHYAELMEKVDRKIRLVSNIQPHEKLRLKYQDEDGDLITINSDDDVQMAFESKGNLNTINLFVTV